MIRFDHNTRHGMRCRSFKYWAIIWKQIRIVKSVLYKYIFGVCSTHARTYTTTLVDIYYVPRIEDFLLKVCNINSVLNAHFNNNNRSLGYIFKIYHKIDRMHFGNARRHIKIFYAAYIFNQPVKKERKKIFWIQWAVTVRVFLICKQRKQCHIKDITLMLPHFVTFPRLKTKVSAYNGPLKTTLHTHTQIYIFTYLYYTGRTFQQSYRMQCLA